MSKFLNIFPYCYNFVTATNNLKKIRNYSYSSESKIFSGQSATYSVTFLKYTVNFRLQNDKNTHVCIYAHMCKHFISAISSINTNTRSLNLSLFLLF